MLKTIFTVATFYCLAFLCSCQKEVDDIGETPTDSVPAGESYMPLTQGTFWVYKDSASGENDTATVLSDELLQDSISYKKVQIKSEAEENYTYYGILKHNYYVSGEQDGINVTMLVLNDLANVGDEWVYDMGTISGVPARGTGTIVEKNIAFTAQGKSYQNVIHTRYTMAYNLLGTYINFATYNFYFAKGIGLIKVQSSIADNMGNISVTSSEELVDYTIK